MHAPAMTQGSPSTPPAGSAGPSAARVVADAGLALFGDQWQVPLARLLDVNERTMRRIAQADREGRDYPAARGVALALRSYLVGRQGVIANLIARIDRDFPG